MTTSRLASPTGRGRRKPEHARPIAAALPLPDEHIDLIDRSHERCAALGLSRIERPDFSLLGRNDMTVLRERNLRLHGHAAPVMEMLFEQIVNTSSMVVLTDATGVVIHSIGDDDFLQRAEKVALAPGANWSEAAKGTNAVGTALVSEAPTLVHADEHYLHANHFLTCSAAPIMDPRGNMLGVLDVSGDRRSYHQHTMALVKMSARMIENQWLADNYRHAMRLHFHSKLGFIGTLMEGILAVTADGRIVGTNRSALDQLCMSSATLRMQGLDAVFGTSVGALVDHFRSPLATPLPVRLADGRSFYLLARFNWPVWSQVAEAAAVAAPPPSEESRDGPAETRVAPAAEPVRSRNAKSAPPAFATGQAVAAAMGAGEGWAALRTGDPLLDAVLDRLQRVVDKGIPVLIQGEVGSGKEFLARALHAESARAQRPFVTLNCATLALDSIEAELLGLERGAASAPGPAPAPGKIQQANGGTLFLDAIGDMPLSLQAHLLRVLEDRQYTPVGSERALPVDLAIVCATHQNLLDLVDAGRFRKDLYYRLNGLTVRMPALRQRIDLLVLVRRILDAGEEGRHLSLSTEVQALMQGYDWPGNVRQLFNVLRTAAAMAGSERWIRPEHLPEDFLDELKARRPLVSPLHELELQAIERAVADAGGNISAAAKRLGVSRNTIYRRLRWTDAAPGLPSEAV